MNHNKPVQNSSMNSLCALFWSVVLLHTALVAPDPQTSLVDLQCNTQVAFDGGFPSETINKVFSDLRSQLSANNTRFAIAYTGLGRDPLYGMVQCRNYMIRSDCLQCVAAAEVSIRACFARKAGHVIFDGCFLRYQPFSFDNVTEDSYNSGSCWGTPIPQRSTSIVDKFLTDLVVTTPKMENYFVASIRQVREDMEMYGVAQCINIINQDVCNQCLNIAYNHLVPCQTYDEGKAFDVRCFLRFSTTAFFPVNQTTDINSFLTQGGSNKKSTIIGAVVGSIGIFLVLAVVALLWIRKLRRNHKRDTFVAVVPRDLRNYKYQDLLSATNNFSKENKLGEGGFGEVYKATLKNGNIVAVKRLAIAQIGRANENFESELKLIRNVQHCNLVRLLGGCTKRRELLLIYEYMANSSLDKFLFGNRIGILNWKQRLDIIIGTAKGLAYLHEESQVCIIHRDIKSSNILLDEEFRPKIADFDLARLLPHDQTHVNTRFAGTLGYMAPEYAIHGHLSPKVDTYSYGVIVLEIISGRKCIDMRFEPSAQYLVEWAWRLYEEDRVMELVDKSLDPDEYDTIKIKEIVDTALLCTQSLVECRPKMSEVVVSLSQ